MAEKLGEAFVKILADDKQFKAAVDAAGKRAAVAVTGIQGKFNSLNMNRAARAVVMGLTSIGNAAAKVVTIATKVGAGLALAFGYATFRAVKSAIGGFAEFEKEMANVSTLVDTSVVDMNKLKKGIMGLPNVLGSATENTRALYQALSAGVAPAKSIAFVGEAARAAKAGLTDTFTAVDAGTTILNAFGMQASEATKVFDQMFKTVEQGKTTFGELSGAIGKLAPIAAAAEVSTEEMFAAIATLTKGGFETSSAVMRMSTALGAVIKPSSEAEKMAEKLGLNFNAAALKARGLAGFLDDVKRATGGNVEEMAQLFGGVESLSVMLALVGKQSEEYKIILDKIQGSTGAVTTAFDKQKTTIDALWTTFKNMVDKQLILLGEKLSPALKGVIEDITAWAEKNKDLIDTKIAEFAEKLSGAIDSARKNFDAFLPVLKGVWEAAKGVAWAFEAIGTGLGIIAAKISLERGLDEAYQSAEKLNEELGKVAGNEFAFDIMMKMSPAVPWREGLKKMKSDLKEVANITLKGPVFEPTVKDVTAEIKAMASKMKAGTYSAPSQPAAVSKASTTGFFDFSRAEAGLDPFSAVRAVTKDIIYEPKIKMSPAVSWAEGISNMKNDLAGVGGALTAGLDMVSFESLASLIKQLTHSRNLSAFFGGAHSGEAMQMEELFDLQKSLLIAQVANEKRRLDLEREAMGKPNVYNISVSGGGGSESDNMDTAASIRRELGRYDERLN